MREIPESYEVRIGAFEGPMDLLLYLVQQSEVKPSDISISEITDQYLEWMKDITKADLSQAGDFLLMASRLMAMKVRELLPKDQRTPEGDAELDMSRDELIKQMLEYQRYKQVAKELQQMELNNFGSFYRGRLEKTESDDDTLADANVWQLFRAYRKTLKLRSQDGIHHIELDDVTIEDRQQFISNTLQREGRVLFEDLLGRDPLPIVTVVTFMALMEMIKTDDVVFRQSELFGAIWLYRKKGNLEYAEEMANETRIYEPDREFKQGLLEKLRERELVRNDKQKATLDQVMRTAALLAAEGKVVKEDDIMAMLDGTMSVALETEVTAAENEDGTPLEASSPVAEVPAEGEVAAQAESESAENVENAEIAASLAENVEPPQPEPPNPEPVPDENAESPADK